MLQHRFCFYKTKAGGGGLRFCISNKLLVLLMLLIVGHVGNIKLLEDFGVS